MAFYNVKDGNLTPVAGGTLYADCPVGTILAYGGATPPAGWFICNGTALNRTSFAELFSVIGTQFGAGNGSTTFNIPDMREMVPRGAGTQSLKTVGAHNAKNVGEFQDDRIQNVTGKIEISSDGTWQPPVDYAGTGAIVGIPSRSIQCGGSSATITDNRTNGFTFDASRVARTGNTTEVKSIGVNYIIKATRIAVPADFMASVHEAMNDSVVTEVTGSGDTGCSFIAHKKNGVVTVWMYTTQAVASTTHSYGTLPAGYRPHRIIRLVGSTGNTTNVDVYGNIADSGVISLLNNTATTEAKYTIATATFIAEK